MLEILVPVAASAALGSVGWGLTKGVGAAVKLIREETKFRASLGTELSLIAKELSHFRGDVNRAMEQEREAHRVEREEYRQTHQDFDKRIALTEQLLARHDERLSQVEDQIRSNHD